MVTALLAALCSLQHPSAQAADAGAWTRLGPDSGVVNRVRFAPGSATEALAVTRGGLFRSSDAGETWGLVLDDSNYSAVAVAYDPSRPTRAFASVHRFPLLSGIMRSLDSGATWADASAGLEGVIIADIAVSQDGTRIYAGAERGPGVFVSTDHGDTWINASVGLPRTGTSFVDIVSLAVHPTSPMIVWAATRNAGVYKSVDGGANWTSSSTGLHSSTPLAYSIIVDAADPNILHLGIFYGNGVYRSTDGGANWQVSYGPSTIQSLVADPRDVNRIHAVGRSGVNFHSADRGLTWTRSTDISNSVESWDVTISGSGPAVLLAATNTGIWRSTDGGVTWVPAAASPRSATITRLVRDPHDRRRVYALGEELSRSGDGGRTFQRAGAGLPRTVSCFEPHPTVPGRILAGHGELRGVGTTYPALYVSSDYGATFTPLDVPLLAGHRVQACAIAPSDPQVIYLVTAYWTQISGNYRVLPSYLRSIDGGQTWSSVQRAAMSEDTSFSSVQTILVKPDDPATVLMAGQGVYRSTDAGESWTKVSTSAPIVMTADPHDSDLFYMGGQGMGLMQSRDAGATWLPLLSYISVWGIDHHPDREHSMLLATADSLVKYWDEGNNGNEWLSPDGYMAGDSSVTFAKSALFDVDDSARILVGITDRSVNEYVFREDLSIVVTNVPEPKTGVGSTTYVGWQVRNYGPDVARSVEFNFQVPPSLRADRAFLDGTACAITATGISCPRKKLGAGGALNLSLTATATSIGNGTVGLTVAGLGREANPADNSSSLPVNVLGFADLGVEIQAAAGTPVTGTPARVSLILSNAGPDAGLSPEVRLLLPTDASLQGASGGDCSQDATTVTCVTDDLAPSGTGRVDLDIVFSAPGAKDLAASIDAEQWDGVSRNDRATGSFSVRGRADLRLRFSAPSPAEITTGQRATYDSVVTNLGPDPATGVAINYTLPSGASSVNATGATCQTSGVTVGCTVATLPSGNSVAIPVAMNLSTTGTMTLSAAATAAEVDADAGNNADSSSVGVSRPTTGADLTVAVTGGAASLQVNKTTTYSFSVTNTGPQATTGGTFTFTVPALLTGSSIKADKPIKCTKGAVMRCTLTAMTVGQTVRGTIKLKAKKTPGTATMTATVTGSPADFDTTNNTATRSVTITSKP